MEPPAGTTVLQGILDRAAQGDPSAYEELIGRSSQRLLRLTKKMLRGYPQLRRWEQTDDVFQNAAIRLYRSLHNLKPDSVRSFMGLAALEIRRTLIDLNRHHFGPEGAAGKHRSDVAGDHSGAAELLKNKPAADSGPRSIAAWAEFHEAVAKLPADEGEVFHLIWYGGLEQREIASLLNVSIPTVQRRWYRARHLLYEIFQGQNPLAEKDG